MQYSMILANNNRSKAYLQNLIKNDFYPKKILILKNNDILPEHTFNDKFKFSNQRLIKKIESLNIEFDEKEDIYRTIDRFNLEYEIVSNDINKEVNAISKLPGNFIIYSGFGGVILKEALNCNKKIVHVHPGIVPIFKGSTTIYYSYLIEKKFGASVIVFNEKIDEGDILYQQEFIIKEKNIDIDYVLDPLVRTKTLIEWLKLNKFSPKKQTEKGNTFYIIHPFLKHFILEEFKSDKS